MSNNDKRIQKLKDEAEISEMIGNLTADAETRKVNRERAARAHGLAERLEQKDNEKE